jgi:hypothetical protein
MLWLDMTFCAKRCQHYNSTNIEIKRRDKKCEIKITDASNACTPQTGIRTPQHFVYSALRKFSRALMLAIVPSTFEPAPQPAINCHPAS